MLHMTGAIDKVSNIIKCPPIKYYILCLRASTFVSRNTGESKSTDRLPKCEVHLFSLLAYINLIEI